MPTQKFQRLKNYLIKKNFEIENSTKTKTNYIEFCISQKLSEYKVQPQSHTVSLLEAFMVSNLCENDLFFQFFSNRIVLRKRSVCY